MTDWTKKMFVERPELFLKFLEERWSRAEELVNGIVKSLQSYGISSGNLLDLCCGNGRVSILMAKRGFRAVGMDISKTFLDDARKKAKTHRVSKMVTFLEGDVRELKRVVGKQSQPFDVVVSAWTSIGFWSVEDDLKVFRQARELSREGALLFIVETTHSDYISLKFAPRSYEEVDDLVLLEDRKYDNTTSQMSTVWTFYRKRGKDLEFLDRMNIEVHVYSVSELSGLLRKAGWEPVALYGNLSTLQPFSSLTRLDLVAKAQ